MNQDAYQGIEAAVAAWCRERPDILAAIVIGSRGRPGSSADAQSDLDLIFFLLQPGNYQHDNDWLNTFGDLWIATLNFVGPGDPEWMAIYAPGIKVDFLFAAAAAGQSLAEMLASLLYQKVLTRGFRILYQSDSLGAEPVNTAASPIAQVPPSEWQFHQRLNATLLTAERFVKFSIRGDTWRSHFTFHGELRLQLLTFIEWHAQTSGRLVDTWYEGRLLEEWADERVVGALPQLELGPGRENDRAALKAALDLLALLATEVAARLGYTYPTPGQRLMIDWLKSRMDRAVD